ASEDADVTSSEFRGYVHPLLDAGEFLLALFRSRAAHVATDGDGIDFDAVAIGQGSEREQEAVLGGGEPIDGEVEPIDTGVDRPTHNVVVGHLFLAERLAKRVRADGGAQACAASGGGWRCGGERDCAQSTGGQE